MLFSKLYDYPDVVPSPNGNQFKEKYRREIGLKGENSLVPDGKEHVYDIIQKAAVGITASELVARFNRGDTTALGVDLESYPDLTKAPKNLIEARNMIIKAQEEFDKLPLDVRQTYNNSLDQWLSAVDSGDFVKFAAARGEELEVAKANAAAAAKLNPSIEERIIALEGKLNA